MPEHDLPDEPGSGRHVPGDEPGVPPAPEVPPAPATPASPPFLSAPDIGRAALVGAVGVGFAFAAAIVVTVLSVALALVTGGFGSGGSSGSVGAGPIGDLEFGGIPFLGPLLWLTVLGLFGQLTVGIQAAAAGFAGSFSVTLTFVPALILVAAVAGTAWWSFRAERRAPSAGKAKLWALAGIGGAAAAVASLVLSAIGRNTVTAGSLGFGALEASTLAVGSFVGPLLVVGLAGAFGRWLAQAPGTPHFGAALWHAPARFRWGTRDAYDYLVSILVVFTLAGLIGSFFAGSGAPVFWPAGAGLYTGVAAALGHFGGYTASIPSFPGAEALGGGDVGILTSGVPGTAWLLVLLAVVTAVAASVLIARRRVAAPLPVREAWRLPVFMTAASLVLGFSVGSLYIAGGGGALGAAISVSAAVIPAWWTALIAAVWGAGVEALARFVAPTLLATWPALARLRIAGDGTGLQSPPRTVSAAPIETPVGGAAAAQAAAVGTAAVGTAEAGTSEAGTPEAGTPEAGATITAPAVIPPRPLSPKAKRGLIVGGIAVAAVVFLGVAGAVTVSILKTTVFSPKPAVEAYVADVAAGRFSDAWQATAQTSSGDTSLVRADSVALAEAMTDVTIGQPTGEGATRSLDVSFDVDGQRDSTVVTVTSAGTQFVFFDVWQIEGGLESAAYVSAQDLDELVIGGVPVALSDGSAEVIAYPGVYDVAGPESEWVATIADPLFVSPSLGGSVSASTEPTPALTDEVQSQVNARLDECALSTEARPEGCPFTAFVFGESRNWAWSIAEYPVVELYGMTSFSSSETGEASATYQRQSFTGEWIDDSDDSSIWARGSVEIVGDEVSVTLE